VASTFLGDLRIGLRVLIKEKSFCALAVIVLALGICGVTTMFGVVNGVMLRGFAFPTADRLVSVTFIDPTTKSVNGPNQQIYGMDYEDLRPVQQSFEMMAAYLNGSTVNVTVDGHPRRYTGAYVTEDFLRAIATPPFKGRDFTAADNKPGADKVAIISYGVWQRDFGGTPDILGKAIRLNGKPAAIVGVMPQGFAFPTNEGIWSPLYSEFPVKQRNDPTGNNPAVLGILKRGVTLDMANAEFTGIAKRFAQAYPDTNKAFTTAQIQPLIETFTGSQLRGTLWTMLGFCVGVLLIACVNVMNMQFARATLRAKELAIRSSLGAGRMRLIRQMLTESLLVASIGATVGIALAFGAVHWLSAAVHALDNPPPSWMVFEVDGRALAVTVFATVMAALASGLLPAWMSSRANAINVLRDSNRGTTSRSVNLISRGLVVFQVVVTCVLLIGSLLQVRSILKQQHIDYGYDTAGVMSARMGLMEGDYPSSDARKTFYDRLLADLKDDPQFEAAGFTTRFRMVFSNNSPIEIDGRRYQVNKDRLPVNAEQVTTGYFGVTGQRVIAGRLFADDETDQHQPVAVVNAAFAGKMFGHDSPLGRRFRTTAADGTKAGPWRAIIGVVSTVRMLGPFNNPGLGDSGYYVPFYASTFGPLQPTPTISQFTTVVVRPHPGQDVQSITNALRAKVAKADPNLPLYFVGTPKSQIETFVAPNRIIAAMFTVFGVVAVVLASVGIYGVMSFSVNQRTNEFGVRMALGADTTRILGMVVRQGAVQIAIGLAVGVGLAFAVTTAAGSAIESTLFGVTGRDPITYLSVIALVTGVSFIATLVPARRATRVDPMIALRAD
jgi:putative ABC transport system permease protein